MTQEIIDMARQAWISEQEAQLITEFDMAYISCTYLTDLVAFAKLVAAKTTDEANAMSNTSWTLMCKKMVEDEREACAKWYEDMGWLLDESDVADAIRARGEA